MKTIAHISDLHFGRVDSAIAQGLVDDLGVRSPTVLVASGDFTQRATARQFAEARGYLQRLPSPQIVVPGNHDIPLWNAFDRFLRPLARYRRFITDDLQPSFEDDGLFVLGLRSARSFTRTSGWLSGAQLSAAETRLCAVPEGRFKVLVTHHPFIPAPRDPDGDIVRGGRHALDRFERRGVDMLLAGHLHLAYHDDVRSHHKAVRRSILSVQAGSAVSTRLRGEPNAYNWITISHDLVTVAVRAWNGSGFEESLVTRYHRVDHVWRRESQVPVDRAAVEAVGSAIQLLPPADAARSDPR